MENLYPKKKIEVLKNGKISSSINKKNIENINFVILTKKLNCDEVPSHKEDSSFRLLQQ